MIVKQSRRQLLVGRGSTGGRQSVHDRRTVAQLNGEGETEQQ